MLYKIDRNYSSCILISSLVIKTTALNDSKLLFYYQTDVYESQHFLCMVCLKSAIFISFIVLFFLINSSRAEHRNKVVYLNDYENNSFFK